MTETPAYVEHVLEAVKPVENGFYVEYGPLGCFVPNGAVRPNVGSVLRVYPGPVGRPIRRLDVDGVEVWRADAVL